MPRSSVDYADYNITVYRCCPYQCRYCYVWRNRLFSSRIMRGKYVPEMEAERIARKMKPNERVVVSFTSDPYPPQEAWERRTSRVIFALRRHGDGVVMVLTKNPILALKDRDVMLSVIAGARHDVEAWLGTTITSADTYHPFSTTLEPNAPRSRLRLLALREYQNQGGRVWLSIEPILPVEHKDFCPETIVNKVLELLDPEKIALIVLGRLNYVSRIKKYVPMPLPSEEGAKRFYREHVPRAMDILKEHGVPCHVKKELHGIISP